MSEESKEFCYDCKRIAEVLHREQLRKDGGGFKLCFILQCGHAKERDPLPQELD